MSRTTNYYFNEMLNLLEGKQELKMIKIESTEGTTITVTGTKRKAAKKAIITVEESKVTVTIPGKVNGFEFDSMRSYIKAWFLIEAHLVY